MDFQDVVRKRKMVRSFEPTRVPSDVLARIVDNAQRAPSAGFSQGFAFVVLEGRDQTDQFWDTVEYGDTRHDKVRNAPLIVVCLSNKDAYLDRYAQPDKGWTDRDEGLGALFFGIVPERIDAFRDTFGVPTAYNPIGAVSVGYVHEDDKPLGSVISRRRRPASELVHRGRW